MNQLSELINELGWDAEQALGKEKAEETLEFNNMITKLHKEDLSMMTMLNALDAAGYDSPIDGMCSVTVSTFVTGMLAYRQYLEDVAPEMVEKVDAHIRNMEKDNE